MTTYSKREDEDGYYIDGQEEDNFFTLPFSSAFTRDAAWQILQEENVEGEVFVS